MEKVESSLSSFNSILVRLKGTGTVAHGYILE